CLGTAGQQHLAAGELLDADYFVEQDRCEQVAGAELHIERAARAPPAVGSAGGGDAINARLGAVVRVRRDGTGNQRLAIGLDRQRRRIEVRRGRRYQRGPAGGIGGIELSGGAEAQQDRAGGVGGQDVDPAGG